MPVLVVGSIAIDTVKTPVEEHSDLLGGSASYAALAASFFSPVRLVGVVGDDFPKSEFDFWKSRKIDAHGVQRVSGKTFRWSGEYSWDLNTRQTRSIDLNVFENFKPVLPKTYRHTDFVLLANIAPSLQAHVLEQMERPRFVVADTMDLWIETARPDLDALLQRVDLLILNDSEAREMTEKAKGANVLALIDHELRFLHGRRTAYKMIRAGEIGKIRHTKSNVGKPGFFAGPIKRQGKGVIDDIGGVPRFDSCLIQQSCGSSKIAVLQSFEGLLITHSAVPNE